MLNTYSIRLKVVAEIWCFGASGLVVCGVGEDEWKQHQAFSSRNSNTPPIPPVTHTHKKIIFNNIYRLDNSHVKVFV